MSTAQTLRFPKQAQKPMHGSVMLHVLHPIGGSLPARNSQTHSQVHSSHVCALLPATLCRTLAAAVAVVAAWLLSTSGAAGVLRAPVACCEGAAVSAAGTRRQTPCGTRSRPSVLVSDMHDLVRVSAAGKTVPKTTSSCVSRCIQAGSPTLSPNTCVARTPSHT